MLPDFPTVKARLQKNFLKDFASGVWETGIVGQFSKETHFEGSGYSFTTPGEVQETESYTQVSSSFTVTDKEVIAKGIIVYYEKLNQLIQEMQTPMEMDALQKIHEATEKTGNVVDASNEEFDQEHIFRLYEMIEINFYEDGSIPELTFVFPPTLIDKVRAKMDSWQNDPNFLEGLERVIRKKKEEWLARESNRKLAD